MRRIWILAPILFAATSLTQAQDIAGDWQGTLHAGAADLHLVLHITKSDSGALKATLDSIDQAANGIPVSSITLKDNKLSLGVDAVHGTYEGKLSTDGNTITGTWSQNEEDLPLDFKRSTTPVQLLHKPAKPSDIDGVWLGTLDISGGIKLRVVFHIVNTEDGLMATLDSPDQGVKGLPTTKVARDGPTLKIDIQKISGTFEGQIAPDLNSIVGTFTQGATMPLVLHRVKDESELEPRRPQNPTKPYPYRDEEVAYDNKAQNVTLAATLTIPPGKGPFPAVVLITGSGPQDRDESLLGHKPLPRFFRGDRSCKPSVMVRPMPGHRSPRPERHTEQLPPAEVQPLPLTVADADVELLPEVMDPAARNPGVSLGRAAQWRESCRAPGHTAPASPRETSPPQPRSATGVLSRLPQHYPASPRAQTSPLPDHPATSPRPCLHSRFDRCRHSSSANVSP